MNELTKEHFDKQLANLVKTDNLGQILDKRFTDFEKVLDKKFDEKFEEQAVLINTAFQAQKDHFDLGIALLDRGQEDIKLKLDNVAYRFELVELQKRVQELEKRAGITTK